MRQRDGEKESRVEIYLATRCVERRRVTRRHPPEQSANEGAGSFHKESVSGLNWPKDNTAREQIECKILVACDTFYRGSGGYGMVVYFCLWGLFPPRTDFCFAGDEVSRNSFFSSEVVQVPLTPSDVQTDLLVLGVPSPRGNRTRLPTDRSIEATQH
jgi:hypothetical protein